jgi:hypothetical protein
MGARCRPLTTVGEGIPADGDPYRKGRRQRPASNIAPMGDLFVKSAR